MGMSLARDGDHPCAALTEEVRQCVIYDGNGKQAKLMGIEYIISASRATCRNGASPVVARAPARCDVHS